MAYYRTVTLSEPYDSAVKRVKEAFADQGFGTLTEIDVKATLKAKLDEDVEPYVILGTCNPNLASRALRREPEIGVLLPCNVVVRSVGSQTVVQALDPNVMADVTDADEIRVVATEAADRVQAALEALQP